MNLHTIQMESKEFSKEVTDQVEKLYELVSIRVSVSLLVLRPSPQKKTKPGNSGAHIYLSRGNQQVCFFLFF